MNGEKVAKQLEKDVAAYRAGFADGYRAAAVAWTLFEETEIGQMIIERIRSRFEDEDE